ncbi:MAG: M48 family metallopeptidase, partial [Deltaproteobacteria bacterium]
ELRFVMGHELGHHIYGHHDIPIGYLLRGDAKPDPRLALELFAWSRYAEISADRAGAHCARDLNGVAKSLFKLASGLTGKVITFDLGDFLDQVDDMQLEDAVPGKNAPKEDWFSTHPFSPLRVKALKLFDESEHARKGGTSKAELEIAVQGLMSLMEPSYMEGKTETATHMRRLLYAGAIAVADASDGISEEEVKIFEKFFGMGEYSKNIDLSRLKEDLPDRAQKARDNTSVPQRMQVLRDLCLVAKASGHTTRQERAVLEGLADDLDIPRGFLCQTMEQQVGPD